MLWPQQQQVEGNWLYTPTTRKEFELTKLILQQPPIKLYPKGFMLISEHCWALVDENNQEVMLLVIEYRNNPSFDGTGESAFVKVYEKFFSVNKIIGK